MTKSYGDMIDRIESETTWTDITSQIGYAIKDAIDIYSAERFWFNDNYRVTATLSSSSAVLIIPTTILAIRRVRLLASTTEYDLRPRDYEWINLMLEGDISATSRPTHYCVYGYDSATFANQLVVDARADQDYPLILDGLRKFTELSATADTNPWMNEAERLIRYCAKKIIYRDVIQDTEGAALAMQAEDEALSDLNTETTRRMATGRIRPTQF